jgi:phycocyanobilin:ferredoxin oxidoreductase
VSAAGFGFAEVAGRAEAALVGALGLRPRPLAPALAERSGTWKDAPVRIETRAYAGGRLRYARFALLRGADLTIANLLCLPRTVYPLPILGADLVALGRERGMLAADLSPVLPPGTERDDQLAALAAARAAHPELPPGGELPAWCAAWFSPFALYTRIGPGQAAAAARAFGDFPRVFAELVRAAAPRPDLRDRTAARQDGYAAAHRTDDKGLGLLAKMFGPAWADRYVAEVLFPPAGADPC